NQIGNLGAIDFAYALVQHPTMEILDLSQNMIGDMGVKTWIELSKEFKLDQLNLSQNEIGESIINQLKSVEASPGKVCILCHSQKGARIAKQIRKNSTTVDGSQSQIGNQRATA